MGNAKKKINPQSDVEHLRNIDIDDEGQFPRFIKSIKFEPFRDINHLVVNFLHPVSVISGTNKIGKSTILYVLACSHFNFNRRNPSTGNLERKTWSDLIKFTESDVQSRDWAYWLTIKRGNVTETKRGQRKHATGRWNGLAKKETQIKDVVAVLIDIDRVFPARHYSKQDYAKSRSATKQSISINNSKAIREYISYVLESDYEIDKLSGLTGRDVYAYKNENEYSSFNSATGEDALSRIIIDIVDAPNKSIILIDEIELGLHPKVQRRLMHVVNHIARTDNKQFIITTHSSTILNSVDPKSRIFIEKNSQGHKAISKISVNAALSKMDSESYPLIDVYCEDDIARKIIEKAVSDILSQNNLFKFNSLVNIIESGAADLTYANFKAHKRTYKFRNIVSGFACILDGDQKNLSEKDGKRKYPDEDGLFFLLSEEAPEKILCKTFEMQNNSSTLKYHISNSNPHCLFEKMVEEGFSSDRYDSFEKAWNCFLQTDEGASCFDKLKDFLIERCKSFSSDL